MSVRTLLRTPSPLIESEEAVSPTTSPLDFKSSAIYNLHKLIQTGEIERSLSKGFQSVAIMDTLDGFKHFESSPFKATIKLVHERLRIQNVSDAYAEAHAFEGEYVCPKKEDFIGFLTSHGSFDELISEIDIEAIHDELSSFRAINAIELTAILHRHVSSKDKEQLKNLPQLKEIFLQALSKKP